HLAPGAAGELEFHAMARLALAADDLPGALQFLGHALVGGDDLIEGLGNLADEAFVVGGHADGEVAGAHGLQRVQQLVEFARSAPVMLGALGGAWGNDVGDVAYRLVFACPALRPDRHMLLPPITMCRGGANTPRSQRRSLKTQEIQRESAGRMNGLPWRPRLLPPCDPDRLAA